MAVLALTEVYLPFSDAPGLTKQCINAHFTFVPAVEAPLPQTRALFCFSLSSLAPKPSELPTDGALLGVTDALPTRGLFQKVGSVIVLPPRTRIGQVLKLCGMERQSQDALQPRWTKMSPREKSVINKYVNFYILLNA